MIIIDSSKAFDTVPHNRLINKLKRYGINNKTHAWISKFLKCGEHRVVVNGEHSFCTHDRSGEPQGLVLGPLLTTPMTTSSPHSDSLFADDCVLYR